MRVRKDRIIAVHLGTGIGHKMSQISLYSQHLAKLLPKVGSKAFCPLLVWMWQKGKNDKQQGETHGSADDDYDS